MMSLISPNQAMSFALEFFENRDALFSASFVYKEPGSRIFFYIRDHNNIAGDPIDIERFISFRKARVFNHAVVLNRKESLRLFDNTEGKTVAFPLASDHYFFGFFILNLCKEYTIPEPELSRIQEFLKIVADSLCNFYRLKEIQNREVRPVDRIADRINNACISELNEEQNSQDIQQNEILHEILPVIFHKLKNKLTPILGYAQILLTKLEDDALKERIRRVEKNAEELTNLLNLLRGYFSGGQKDRQRENINSTVYYLNNYFKAVEEKENIKIKVKLDHMIPDDLFIPGQMACLVTNLIDNAVLAIKAKCIEDGLIEVQTKQLKNSYRLIIKDNGIGISQEDIPRIWGPFFSHFPDRPGLGLSICERIIANHGAQFRLSSVEGKYTEFQIILRNQVTPSHRAAMSAENGKRDFTGNILIADREEHLVDLMKEMLVSAGNFEIMTTTHGEEATALINSRHFDLIIIDYFLPRLGGIEVYELLKLKKLESKVIMLIPDHGSTEIRAFLTKYRIKSLKKPFEILKFKGKVLEKLNRIQKSYREETSKMV